MCSSWAVAAVYLATPDTFRGVLLASKEVLAEVLACARRGRDAQICIGGRGRDGVRLPPADVAGTTGVWLSLIALPDQLGNCAALKTLTLTHSEALTALPEQLGNCAALIKLDLSWCCLTALPGRLGDCAALRTLRPYCQALTMVPERLGDCAVLTMLVVSGCPLHRAARAARRLRGVDGAGPDGLRIPY